MCMCETKRDKSSLWIVSVLCLGDQNYNNNTYILELLFIKPRKHHGVRKIKIKKHYKETKLTAIKENTI